MRIAKNPDDLHMCKICCNFAAQNRDVYEKNTYYTVFGGDECRNDGASQIAASEDFGDKGMERATLGDGMGFAECVFLGAGSGCE